MRKFLFGDDSLRVQSYIWFFVSLAGLITSFFLSTKTLILCTNILSWLAITISAQTFIAAAKANKKLGDPDK